jgi:hypothetical protein
MTLGPVPATVADRLFGPAMIGGRTFPSPLLLLLAAVGATLLLVVAVNRWATPSDEHAYWLAAGRLLRGELLYDPTAGPATPYAYWYPPPLAQVLAPLTPFVPDLAFTAAWTILLLGCLLYLADRRLLVALALVAFIPVAVELWSRNIHLVLAALAILALRRSPLFWVPAAALKITPVIGVAYLAAAGRWREAVLVSAAGGVVLAVSALVSPGAWTEFMEVVGPRGAESGGLVAIPFGLRFAAAVGLAVLGGRLGGRRGESLLVLGLVVGNPTLWMTAFSLLVILVPIRSRMPRPHRSAVRGDPERASGSAAMASRTGRAAPDL